MLYDLDVHGRRKACILEVGERAPFSGIVHDAERDGASVGVCPNASVAFGVGRRDRFRVEIVLALLAVEFLRC